MNNKKNDNLLKFSIDTPWQFTFVVILYVVGAVGFPTSIFTCFLGESENAASLALFLARIICCILPIWLAFEIKLHKIFSLHGFFANFLIIVPFLIVVINNFPILPLIQGKVFFNVESNFLRWICYLCAVFGGVFLEEITFRGIIFPVLYKYFRKKKNGVFLSVFISSALFGIVHLFNLLAGAGIGSVVMQIGYSLLIGGMCSIAFLKTGNFYNAILLHFIFNIGGMLYDQNMIAGNIWTTQNILLTAILAVVVTVFALYILFKVNNLHFESKILDEE